MKKKDLTTEIEQLIATYKNGWISYAELYFELQKYPVEERDKVLALHILKK